GLTLPLDGVLSDGTLTYKDEPPQTAERNPIAHRLGRAVGIGGRGDFGGHLRLRLGRRQSTGVVKPGHLAAGNRGGARVSPGSRRLLARTKTYFAAQGHRHRVRRGVLRFWWYRRQCDSAVGDGDEPIDHQNSQLCRKRAAKNRALGR